MENKIFRILVYFTLLSLGLTSFFWGVIKAQGFLSPLVVAILLMMVVLPISKWMEKNKISRGWTSFLSTLIILLFFVVISGVVGIQIKNFTEKWPEIRDRLKPHIDQSKDFVEDKTGIEMQIPAIFEYSENESAQNQSSQDGSGAETNRNDPAEETTDPASKDTGQPTGSSSGGNGEGSIVKTAGGYAISFFGFMGSFILTFIYVFFFLLYRKKFKNSILKMTPDRNRNQIKDVISKSMHIAQNYLFGRVLLIIFLAIIYAIGLSISGVEQPILISVLAAVLSLMPYIGNIVGYGLAITMAFIAGSGITGILGVTITFTIAQFVESYILEPYVVGDKVNINPVFTIIVVVLGGAVWGIIGMLVAIPLLGILKVIFDHIPALASVGYLFGGEDIGNEDDDDGIFKKVNNWFSEKFSKKNS
ncbi:MAG TPA: AI-2E family transporter [Anditalea sp.]|nr:AI-2E family transporter [Anditalea sp.]